MERSFKTELADEVSRMEGGTVVLPSRDQSLRSVSSVLHRLVSDQAALSAAAAAPTPTVFDIDNFVRKTYRVAVIAAPRIHAVASFVQAEEHPEIPVPGLDSIYRFLKTIFDKLQLSTECAIIALIYIERILAVGSGLPFHARNWRPLLLSALLTASKVWDDLSSWNIEFSEIFPIFSLQDINCLEVCFLEGLKWNLAITGSEYARYYFSLRALLGATNQTPRWEKSLAVSARKAEVCIIRETTLSNVCCTRLHLVASCS
jgi:hypothetical protein